MAETGNVFIISLYFSHLVCFKVFDVDRDGVLSRDELHEMVVALLEVWKDNRTDTLPVSLEPVDFPLSLNTILLLSLMPEMIKLIDGFD